MLLFLRNDIDCCWRAANGKVIFDLIANKVAGDPDGMTIDKNGNLWVACFNSNHVSVVRWAAQVCQQLFYLTRNWLWILVFRSWKSTPSPAPCWQPSNCPPIRSLRPRSAVRNWTNCTWRRPVTSWPKLKRPNVRIRVLCSEWLTRDPPASKACPSKYTCVRKINCTRYKMMK